uniref:Uncharacterized protein n=1 Tax=viral metagenome TaxID=1070528 RepID=A0A6H2A1V6_9ZZZZ
MTKAQFLEKFEDILGNALKDIRATAERLFDSGAVDRESYEDDYLLPKIILTASLVDAADSWRPFDKKARRTVANLRHF